MKITYKEVEQRLITHAVQEGKYELDHIEFMVEEIIMPLDNLTYALSLNLITSAEYEYLAQY